MLSTSAFNALLKTLEEPPEHVVFVLATTEVHKIPQTILSRCQRFDFRRIPLPEITAHLKTICQEEDINFEEKALSTIAKYGDGSMRDSQSLLDQVITFSNNNLTYERTVKVLGLTDRSLLYNILQAVIEQSTPEMLNQVKLFHISGHDPNLFIKEWLEELRNLLLVKLSSEKQHLFTLLDDDAISQLHELGKNLSQEDIHALYDISLKGALDISHSIDPEITLEMLLLRLCIAPRMNEISHWLRQEGDAFSPAKSKPENIEEEKKKISKPELPPLTNEKSLEDQWFSFVELIRTKDPILTAQIENTFLDSFDHKDLVIAIPEKLRFLQDKIDTLEFKKNMSYWVEVAWQKSFNLRVKLTNNTVNRLTPKQQLSKNREDHQQKLIRNIEDDPFVKKTNEILNGKIVKIKELR
jgi:DNA polymerase-3 subunit gamma/tau